MIINFSVEEVSNDLSGSHLYVYNSSLQYKASFAGNLRKEAISGLEASNPVKLKQFIVLNTIQEGSNWAHRIRYIFYTHS